ncbi:hypothetical protein BC332_11453 [Capsicum chinense]|nr:hypothetical protein BC332_11453 [Capsicum chinense]
MLRGLSSSRNGFFKFKDTKVTFPLSSSVCRIWYFGNFCPTSSTFGYFRRTSSLKCRLVNVSSLVTASLTFIISCTLTAGTNMILRKIVVMIIIKFQKPCAGLSSKVELCDRANNWNLACRDRVHDESRRSDASKIEMQVSNSEVVSFVVFENCSTMRSFHFLDPDFLLYSSLAIPPPPPPANINLPSWIPNTVFPNFKSVKIASCRTGCLKKWSKGSFCRLFKLFEVSSEECSGFPEACNRCKKEKTLHLFRELCPGISHGWLRNC